MPTEPRPSWFTAQEHGVLAEAGTRAFLLDRFWVLERSIDIEGADFMVFGYSGDRLLNLGIE